MKQIIAFCIFILTTFTLSADEEDRVMTISKQYIISPDKIVSIEL
ncbi:hypothetical protein JM98_01669 [Treponema putidum]|nr:hypothetical protein JM98_01669 [Treponema putidum]